MSDDGADLGVKAKRALDAVFGGPQPSDDEKMDPIAFETWLMSQTRENAMKDYDSCAAYAARCVLVYLRAHPEAIALNERGLFDDIPEVHGLGMTGFMWGWAVNAARRCLELPPVPNPAIVTIEVPE